MLSIITALYKSDRYLEKYLKKLEIFAAELKAANISFEVIFVPKRPSPKERALLDSFKTRSWCREIVSPEPGLYGSWNSGVLAAKGDMVAFWNVDDFRYSQGMKEAVSLIGQGADLVYSPFWIRRYLKVLWLDFLVHIQKINKQVPEFNEANYPEFLRSMLLGPFFVFTRKLYEQVGPFDEQFKSASDFDWCIRAAKISKKIKRGRELAGSFRVDGRGISSGGKSFLTAENNTILFRHKVFNKILPAQEEISKNYRPGQLLFRGQWSVYSDAGMANIIKSL